MDFDHRDPSTKSFRLTEGRALLKNRAALLAEADKCDIVCANCHRARTYRQWLGRLAAGESRARDAAYLRKWRRAREQAVAIQRLRAVPCLDWGQTRPFYAMEFDHRDATDKKFEITRAIGRMSLPRILEEAKKCDILRTNCHRDRTFRRRLEQAGVV